MHDMCAADAKTWHYEVPNLLYGRLDGAVDNNN